MPEISEETLKRYVNELEKINIPFYFVMNNLWSNYLEHTINGQREIEKYIKKLIDYGVKGLILANPYLIKYIRKKYPDIKISASINLEIYSASMIQDFLDFGANYVVLARDHTRDFKLIKRLSKKYKENLVLLANSSCLLHCPLQYYHPLVTGFETLQMNLKDAYSIEDKKESLIDSNFCFDYCLSKLANNPHELLKIPWIRPEDVKTYRKLGIKHLKIQGRTKNLKEQIKILKAYFNGKSPNDDFLFLWPNIWRELRKYVNSSNMKRLPPENFKILSTEMDKLGFIDFFHNKENPCSYGCDNCNHCSKTFDKLLKLGGIQN